WNSHQKQRSTTFKVAWKCFAYFLVLSQMVSQDPSPVRTESSFLGSFILCAIYLRELPLSIHSLFSPTIISLGFQHGDYGTGICEIREINFH
ncbi:hypothetical protein, partial [Klebsiella pneumoniae]|uniref:hypothetical protein n=1 Tax=Klebsiella pneumoniae TaxID=573 RepID=UPI0040557781